MAEEVAALNVRLEATVAKFEQGMRRAESSMRRSTAKMERNAQNLDRRLERVGDKFGVNIPTRAIAATAAIAAIGKVISEVIKNGDKVKLLEARFKALTGSAERGAKAFQNVLDVSTTTGTAIDDVASAMSRFTLAAESIGATDDEVSQLTENVLKLGRIGGATTGELSSGAMQLAQALASGRLQGDELRSILENMPLVAKAIADGLGVSVGQLRQMGSEGELTARKVFDAILGKTNEINEKFGQMPQTVDQATTRMANAWTNVTAKLDDSIGLSETWISLLNTVARLLDGIADAEGTAARNIAEITGRRLAGLDQNTGRAQLATVQEQIAGLVSLGDPKQEELLLALRKEEALLAARVAELENRQFGASYPGFTTPGVAGAGPAQTDPLTVLGLQGNYQAYGEGRGTVAGATLPSSAGGGGGGAAAAVIDSKVVDQAIASMERYVQTLVEQRGEIGLTGVALAEYRAGVETARMVQELETRAREEGVEITAEQRAQIETITGAYTLLTVEIERQNAALEENRQKAENAQAAMDGVSNAITSGIQGAKNFSDALKNIALNLANLAIQGLFGQGPAGGFFNDLLGVGANGLVGLLSAKGNAFDQSGQIKKFARGGVVNGATGFQFGNGNIGVMGEKGPEAILPLKRGAGGRLGVETSGGGGRSASVTFNITTPSVESFRASQGQLYADAARHLTHIGRLNN